MANEVTLRLFGRFRASVAGKPVPEEAWHGHRAKAVVKLLALAPNHQLHREQLMESLWPGLPTAAAGANLRKALHYARQGLPAATLRVRDAVMGLDAPGLWVDVDAFRAAAAVGDVPTAMALYTDDLLVEDRYESWAEEYRAQLRERFRGLLHRAADQLLREENVVRAQELFERLLRLDPLDQAAAEGLARTRSTGGPSVRDAPGVPDRGEPAGRTAAGERKLVTVVVLDAIPAPGAGDPEDLARDLERWTSLATDVLGSWDGVCERLLPGTVLAVFGVPRLHEDDAARALHGTLDLLARSPLAVRAGVATGEVVVRADSTGVARGITGEVMAAADRWRQAAPVGGVAVAERTCRLVTRFRFDEPVCLGGAGLPELWGRVLLGRVVDNWADTQPVVGPMVGRDAELAAVVEAFDDAARSGSPRFLTVIGPAGMGKSRLVDEAVATLTARSPGMRVLRGRCLPAGSGGVYSALGEILCRACGISLTDPVPTVQTRLRRGLRALFGRNELSEATLGALAASVGIALPDAALDVMDPRAVADELSRAWPRFVAAVAGPGPAVVVVEDLHWAGDELLDALVRIATAARRPVLFLATGRPELLGEHADWLGALQTGAVISLAPLDERHSGALLTSIRVAEALPAATRQRLLARAEGNPFFLQELALHAGHAHGPIPDTVSAVLAARLDATGPDDKLVLQHAAVVGRVFWAEPVARGVGRDDVPAALDRLAREGFLVRRPGSALPGHPEYAFRHALIHEVACASLPRDRRARAHADVGTWLEETAGRSRNDLAELLAFHWAEAAGDPADVVWPDPADRERVRRSARRWLVAAGNVARARFATTAAIEWHARALALAITDGEKVEALEALGRNHDAAFSGEEAVRWYREALTITRGNARLAVDRARLCRRIAWLMATSPGAFQASPDPHAVDALLAEGLQCADDESSRAWLLLTHGVSARLWRGSEPFGQGREPDPVPIGRRVRSAETALRVGREHGQPDLALAAERALKILYGLAGRYREAVALAYRHVDPLPSSCSTLERADLLREAAVYAVTVDADYNRGLSLAQRCRALTAEASPHQLMHATWPQLVALYHLGRWTELDGVAEEHLAALRAMGGSFECQFVRDGPFIAATAQAHRGEFATAQRAVGELGDRLIGVDAWSSWQVRFELARGNADAARLSATAGVTRGGLSGPQYALCLLDALVAVGDWPAVEKFLPSARVAAAGNRLLAPLSSRASARLRARAGRWEEAADELRSAISALDSLGVVFEAARAREDLASLLPSEAGHELLAGAVDVYRRLGADSPLVRDLPLRTGTGGCRRS